MISRRGTGAPMGTRAVAAVTLAAFAASTVAPLSAWAATPPPAEAIAAPSDSTRADVSAEDLQKARQWLADLYGQPVQIASEEENPESDDAEPKAKAASKGAREESVEAPGAPGKALAPVADDTVEAEGLPTASRTLVTGKTISVPKGEATLQGMGESFSAQLSTGIATFSVPFALPKARGDAQPSLGLSYSSSGGAGLAGVGWSLGVPFIARQTDRGTPKYLDQAGWHAEQDRFVFNGGQELVPVCVVAGDLTCAGAIESSEEEGPGEFMPCWSSGYQYFRPRVEGSFLRFFWSADHRSWRVQAKSGVTMELGVPLDGTGDRNALEENPAKGSGDAEIYRWLLVRQYDLYGNANPCSGNPAPSNVVRYRYTRYPAEGNATYLTDIFDTTPASTPTTLDDSLYAHHVRIRYEDRPDPSESYRSGWRMDQKRRLAGVDVTSKPFSGVSAPREILRRYHLDYDAASHVSLLASIQVEGRCAVTGAVQVREGSGQALPASTNCPTLPAMRFQYSHVEGHLPSGTTAGTTLAGYEPFDERVHDVTDSPPHSLDEEQTVLHDIDSDALPDVLVTAPGFFGGKHGVFFNGSTGTAGRFSASTIGVQGVLGANANTITLGNANVVPLDVDGDATADLVHMPLVKKYAIYTPVKTNGAWWWQGRAVETADSLNPKIDFGRDAAFTRVVDVNFDGLVDVVRTTGTELQTYFALGRYPKGDGRFGQGTWTSKDTATLSTDPVRMCLPWSGTAVSFGDKDIQLADMNGDGIVDIVRVRRGDIQYWPGRGNGFWGTGSRDDCPGGTFGQGRAVSMAKSPYYSDIQGDSLRLDDVNGDGLSDLVQVRFQDLDVWLNVDGGGFTQSHTLHDTPASPSYANRVRLTDVNGSGTPDVLWGDAGKYRYIDLAGGVRPWLLTRVENGLGKSTDLEYGTSVEEMLAAKTAGKPWPKGMPTVTHVVKRVTVKSNLVVVGATTVDATEYGYAEPVYDGLQREFRGFRRATARRVGDANSPAETIETRFLLGECIDETTNSVSECTPAERWRDNPREALKGLPYVVERKNGQDVYHSTAHTSYELRPLYEGLDGREVRYAPVVQDAQWLYDAGAFTPLTTWSISTAYVDAPGPDVEDSASVRSFFGQATVAKSFVVDRFGDTDFVVDWGCVGGGPCGEFTEEGLGRETSTGQIDPSSEGSGWVFRASSESVTGDPAVHAQAYNAVAHEFDDQGRVIEETVSLMGTVQGELARIAPDSAYFPPRSSGTGASPINVLTGTYQYDTLGNLTQEAGPNLRCRTISYDPDYKQFPISETVYAAKGLNGSAPGVGAGCGGGAPALDTDAAYDRGLGVATLVTDVTDQPTKVVYDEFGRLSEIHEPHKTTLGAYSVAPTLYVEYDLPSEAEPRNYSTINVLTQDGANDTLDAYHSSRSYVDGLGRTFVTVKESDEPQQPIISGLTVHDNKSAVRLVFLDHEPQGCDCDDPTWDFAGSVSEPERSFSYDAFGRLAVATDWDETPLVVNTYHALSVDIADAEDINIGGPHENTHVTEHRDGHGRVVKTTERFKSGSVMDARITETQYLPTGAPEIIRRHAESAPSVIESRYLVYDTLGRLVVNVEPNSTANYSLPAAPNLSATNEQSYPTTLAAWRYRYNDAGDLVGMTDPRGCGVNYFYDGLGRLLLEDYFRCATQHVAYSVPTFTAQSLPNTGIEVAYEYDVLSAAPKPTGWTPPALLMKGRLARVRDQGAHDLFWYDGRGNVTQEARQIARAGTIVNAMGTRFSARWYKKATSYDAADRVVTESTGATQLLGTSSLSTVTTAYSERGTTGSVSSSYGSLITQIVRDPDDFVRIIRYGDLAETQTAFDPDDRRRPWHIFTNRSPPSGWPSDWATRVPNTFQTLLEYQVIDYDLASNPVDIRDFRDEAVWSAGAKPVDRHMEYDDFYRVKTIDYSYVNAAPANHDDPWTPPFADEIAAFASTPSNPQSAIDSRQSLPNPHISFTNRVRQQNFVYDWRGNTSSTTDDAGGFYDRSLGTIVNGVASSPIGPHQIRRASITTGTPKGELTAQYDLSGNVIRLDVDRDGPCILTSSVVSPPAPAIGCSQVFKYEWDEVNRLTRASRWDRATLDADSPPSVSASHMAVDLRYRYDSSDNRTLKSSKDVVHAAERHTVYIFDSLELRRAAYGTPTANEYDLTSSTEVPYLLANGVRIARVVYEPDTPESSSDDQHVFFELGDHLGSTTTVLDKATGELVEKSTYQAYGAAESDYRTDRWDDFREDYRFTGKEEDIEVGLTYFGKRFYSPNLGRWMSPDPLGVHDVGKADLNLYAYVSGQALKNVDPLGLDSIPGGAAPPEDASKGMGAPQEYEKTPVQAEVEVKAAPPLESVPHWQGVLQATPERNPETRGHFLRRQALTDTATSSLEAAAVAADLATGNMTPMPFAEIVAARRAEQIGGAMMGGRRLTLASGGGGAAEEGLTVVRTLERGEKWADVQDEMRYLQWSTNREHYLISNRDGSVRLFSGGEHSTTFEFTPEMRRLLMHTHPKATGPSQPDMDAMTTLGQRSSWLLEPGVKGAEKGITGAQRIRPKQ